MNILTCVLPQSDGQAESQYAAARKATQDRFGFYQVTSTYSFWFLYHLFSWIFFLVSANFHDQFSLSQGSNPKWTYAFSTIGGTSRWQGLLR